MTHARLFTLACKGLSVAALSIALMPNASAQDKVKFGVFPASSALPFYIAQNKGLFKEAGLEVEEVPMTSHPLTIQAIVSGNIDGAANLVTLEGANIETRRANTLKYIALNGQNSEYVVEQFVVKAGSKIKSLKDIKGGVKLFSAPGPANIGAARAVLKKQGLIEGTDFTIQEQPVGMHLSVLQAGTFDGGYTLEPAATMMVSQKIASRVESGVIATHLLGRKDANAFATGAAFSAKFIAERPDVARRFAEAWARGVELAKSESSTRGYLVAGMKVPPELAATIPLPNFVLTKDLDSTGRADFQKFLDVGQELGVIKDTVPAASLLKAY
ncbi:MAG: PhnD/SsuA/transferrin family substrate-binding protein [Azoarcus sp. PHD]|nr:MAG: PhnD/SsuA/transferrin family substrate-binding protein [Azoarcus sp. PHD]